MSSFQVIGIALGHEVRPGDDIGGLIDQALRRTGTVWRNEDILVVAQKIVSKSEGRLVDLKGVTPSKAAIEWGRRHHRDPRVIEVVLSQARRIVRMDRGVVIVEANNGLVCANAGVDQSNCPKNHVTLLPEDADRSAVRLRREIERRSNTTIACIVSDTFGRPWRMGQANVAIGAAGIAPLIDWRGHPDLAGRTMEATQLAVADELAAAAGLVMGKADGVPAVLIRGYKYRQADASARELIRPPEEDLFR